MDRDDDLDEFGLRDVEITPPTKPVSTISPIPSPSFNHPVSFSRSVVVPGSLNAFSPTTFRSHTQLGTGLVTIQPGCSTQITTHPQKAFRMEKLIVSESITGSTILENMFVGSNSPFFSSGSGGIASSHFSGNSFGNGISGMCEPGIDITFQVRNVSTQSVAWTATLFGIS